MDPRIEARSSERIEVEVVDFRKAIWYRDVRKVAALNAFTISPEYTRGEYRRVRRENNRRGTEGKRERGKEGKRTWRCILDPVATIFLGAIGLFLFRVCGAISVIEATVVRFVYTHPAFYCAINVGERERNLNR